MKSLGEFLPIDAGFEIIGSAEKKVSAFQFDSRKVTEGVAFVARRGSEQDGHDFIEDAITLGCEVVICERLPGQCKESVTYIRCHSVTAFIGKALCLFYGIQWERLQIIGVTGTNGKTTVATLLFQLFKSLGYSCGLISTIENRINDELILSTHTTPDQISLYGLLHQMQEKNCSHVFMEVSSHALDQERVGGVPFETGIFTNITHDHLDYHKTFKDYLEAKKKFFDKLPKAAIALINCDDKNGRVMVQNSKATVKTYALTQLADFHGRILENSITGLHLKFNDTEWHSRLIGEFNAYNLLAVFGCAMSLGLKKEEVLENLSSIKPPEGRFDWIQNELTKKVGIVDYAHTPDALEKILMNIRRIKTPSQKITTVIGCGGNRDREKRPLMAKIAVQLSDQVILTMDNPRFENPLEILSQMETGIPLDKQNIYTVIADRTQAIKTACMMTSNADIILVAGKGHEKYQEIKGQKLPFDDMKTLKQFLLN